MRFNNSTISLKKLEALEHKYLMKYWYFLKFVEDDIIKGLHSKEEIRLDWDGKYKSSEFDVGCERIIYALLNGKIAGQPNSSPVSSDLFFEVDDAFIHIDLKTVTTKAGTVKGKDNIGDFNTDIFIGENQNSYRGKINVRTQKRPRPYKPNLPVYYTKENGDKKITLTYFVCILNNAITQRAELISIMCMPNGLLEKQYGRRPLKAGKNPGKTRFNFSETPTFELLPGEKKRVRIIYKNPEMSEWVKNRLKLYLEIFDPMIEE